VSEEVFWVAKSGTRFGKNQENLGNRST